MPRGQIIAERSIAHTDARSSGTVIRPISLLYTFERDVYPNPDRELGYKLRSMTFEVGEINHAREAWSSWILIVLRELVMVTKCFRPI